MKKLKKLKYYISKRIYPLYKPNAQKQRVIEKFKNFIIENNKLVFKPLKCLK